MSGANESASANGDPEIGPGCAIAIALVIVALSAWGIYSDYAGRKAEKENIQKEAARRELQTERSLQAKKRSDTERNQVLEQMDSVLATYALELKEAISKTEDVVAHLKDGVQTYQVTLATLGRDQKQDSGLQAMQKELEDFNALLINLHKAREEIYLAHLRVQTTPGGGDAEREMLKQQMQTLVGQKLGTLSDRLKEVKAKSTKPPK